MVAVEAFSACLAGERVLRLPDFVVKGLLLAILGTEARADVLMIGKDFAAALA